jgi:hypothetical protein
MNFVDGLLNRLSTLHVLQLYLPVVSYSSLRPK